ncbi:DUF3422 domain-containing protein [Sphingomonas sp. 1P06PA]|uniref:DUF3422 family protein n=1 Tax=Sphingomonas sp. 1P06PA TaxID=554121 RepID=UPI0039A567F6
MTDQTEPAAVDPLGLVARSHPLRAALAYEMHLRQLPPVMLPSRLLQVVTLLGEGAHESRAHVAALHAGRGLSLPDSSKHAMLPIDGFDLVWERHTEFASYTLLLPGPFDDPFDPAAFAPVHPLLDGIPGQIIRATLVALLPRGMPADPDLIAASFKPLGLVSCDVAAGKARIWSDFQLNADGLGRLLIADQGLEGDEPGQLVQRIQELGNYRNMALLGLPLAQTLTPDVSRLEQRLAALTQQVAEPASDDDSLLDELTFLTAELARLLASTRYRMAATRAYAQLSAERLESLAIVPLPGWQTLADFTDRRLMPAVRTCESFSRRLEDLSQRAAWTSSLLRTRIDTALARQNRDLLASVDRRADLQLRLQQTVEGLSVVAISYYLVALLGYMLYAVPGVSHKLAVAIAVPFVVIAVALMLRPLKRPRS